MTQAYDRVVSQTLIQKQGVSLSAQAQDTVKEHLNVGAGGDNLDEKAIVPEVNKELDLEAGSSKDINA